ncbi:MAG: FeS assembly protein SufB, Fe-S cluster assembly protein SufB [Candidatus Gottesmanbacteria bacterium GW2011_GWA2_43_14]|uniref:FeS assembly protein SufB, Fe-S cluster assembly protein SufB n=1 Tax=Candidatus Gottesmanbacteria bacterium GW2011_GWA2_43_14 TaxID=1618443 RepID=A0A0G1FN75_9BACT|nr:MAG: FeS assembly protein SufB, Fe-S cluster assembly protein SufB [Candidatus Gottesmanbacteria bacterium GW2011_GWA2_43_14]
MSNSILPADYRYGFKKKENYVFKSRKGLDKKIVREISYYKNEPEWMREFRLQALDIFYGKKLPSWGGDLTGINFNDIYYYIKPVTDKAASWEELPKEIKDTYDAIGIPEAEKKYLGGVSAQYESEVVYKSIKKTLGDKGVVFLDMDSGLREYPELVREYFGSLIPPQDNKFSALNSAVWSGGSFIYVPKGVRVELPLQAYFRINAANMGQFERTLIIADEGSYVHYVEGCTAPVYTTDSLHSAVVEIFVKKGARVRYTTIQNWSQNVYNLVTKRMKVEADGFGEWIDGNIGSKLTMKYPSVYLMGKGARGEVLSVAYAGKNQHQDAGGKAVHFAPFTSSKITSKSVSAAGGRTSYRGLVQVFPSALKAKTKVVCDALIIDDASRSDTYPTMDIRHNDVKIEHEATVSKIGDDQLFYMNSRGLNKSDAEAMIVNGFIEPIVRELPLEYAVELNRLIQLEMKGSVG